MQLRTLIAASAIGLSLACVAGLASAQQIYKWKDANGVTHFSQTPPVTGTHYTKMRLANEPEVASSPASSATAENGSESEPDAAPRQAAASSSGELDTPSNRATLCKQLSSNIALLQGKQPVVTGSGNGKQEVMSDQAREQQLSTARAQQTQYCSSKGG